MFHWFYKTFLINTFYVLLTKILHLKKTLNISTDMLEFTIKRGVGAGSEVVKRRGTWNI